MTARTRHYEQWMRQALEQAAMAYAEEEVPVGAVVVCGERVVGRGRNSKERSHDPTAHAEIEAIREAAGRLGRWRLTGCTMVVTLEPCPMCMGAIWAARMDGVVFGCRDPRSGAALSLYRIGEDRRLNHRVEVVEGVLAEESAELLKSFFAQRR